jgi:glycosyltransferase involved in cell wall biosynthesis
MPLVSVITPVLPAHSAWLTDTWHSLRQQEPEPDHPWDWEWLVQRDGPESLQEPLPDDSRIRQQANPVAFGPALARTLALARARGSLVKVLDADDQLTPGQLAREVAVFRRHPEVGWLTSAALDLLPDGRCVAPQEDGPEGAIPIGWVSGWWRQHGRRLPVHPASLCVRSELLRALGGWMALPASEDTGLLLALNAVAQGWHLGQTGLLYRKWPSQLTASSLLEPRHSHRQDAFAIAEQRAEALAAWGVRWPAEPDSPQPDSPQPDSAQPDSAQIR